jgi:hypothetical protein
VPGRGAERREHVGSAAAVLGVEPGPAGGVDLPAPVDAEIERAVRDERLGRGAPPVAGDVARRHRDEVGCDTEVIEGGGDTGGAEQVDLHGAVEGRVEGHRCRRVDHDVAAREDGAVRLGEAEPVGADVAGDDAQAPGHHLVERLGPAELGPQPVEGVVADHLALHPLGRRRPAPGPDEQDDLALGHGAQQSLHQRRAEEAGGAGDGDALGPQCGGDHEHCLPYGK